MARILGEFADLCQSTDSLDRIEQDLKRRLAEFGVCHFVHVEAVDAHGRPSGALLAGPSNREWRALYFDKAWAQHDDLMKSGLKSVMPSTWLNFREQQPISAGQQRIFDAAGEFGFRDGYFLPIHQLDGSVTCVSLFSNDVLPVRGARAAALHMLSLYYSFAVRRLAAPVGRAVQAAVQLTPRQRECLQWVRAGKTDWEISRIIGISEHTVIEHLDQARRRLGVRNRTQAVIEAVSRGLIHI